MGSEVEGRTSTGLTRDEVVRAEEVTERRALDGVEGTGFFMAEGKRLEGRKRDNTLGRYVPKSTRTARGT